MENEIWKDVEGFESFYEVSNFGNVRRIKNHLKVLKQELTKGYLRITMSKNSVIKRMTVHRLVALTFIPNHGNKKCVNHIDGNKLNNNISNLEWVSYSENEIHSYIKLGKINHNRKLSDIEILDIRINAKKCDNNRKLKNGNIDFYALKYNVDRKTIHNILNKYYYGTT